MNSLYKVSVLATCVLISFSCKLLNRNQSTADSEKEKAVKSIPEYVLPVSPYQASDAKVWDLIHTKLEVSFNWEKQYLNGKAYLKLKPYFYNQNTLVLDAKGFDIDEVVLMIDDQQITPLFSYDGLKLVVNLPKELNRSEQLNIQISYVAKPNELISGGSGAIISDIGLYFINPLGEHPYKPKQIWTQGETQASSCWFPTIDSPNQRTTQEIEITVDSSYVTLSNGELRLSMMNGDGTRTDRWVQSKPHAPYLFMMAVGEFDIVTDTLNEGLLLNYYMEPTFSTNANRVFGNTAEMVAFFGEKLNYPFPWTKYSQIVVRDYVSGAMENTSASLFIEYLNQDGREALDKNWDYIIAHELFHQWFGDLVTCESWSNLALNESFANYSEYLWSQYKYGQMQADHLGYDEMDDYFYEARTKRAPIVRYNYENREDMFDGHSYNKGGRVLHMLRTILGDEAFFGGLNKYLTTHQYSDVEIHELRLAFEDYTGLDLHLFFEQWFLSAGHPELDVASYWSNDTLTVSVKQVQDTSYAPVFAFPVQLAYYVDGVKIVKELFIDKTNTVFEIPTSEVDLVLFDDQNYLLAEIHDHKSLEEAIYQFKHEEAYLPKRKALESIALELKSNVGLSSDSLLYNVLLESVGDLFWYHKIQTLKILEAFDFNDQTKEFVKGSVLGDSSAQVRLTSLSLYNKITSSDSIKDIAFYQKVVEDSSYKVSASALKTLLEEDTLACNKYILRFKESRNIDYVNTLAHYFIDEKDTTTIEWMWDNFEYFNFWSKVKMAARIGEMSKAFQSSEKKNEIIKKFEEKCREGEFVYDKKAAFIGLCFCEDSDSIKELRNSIITSEKNESIRLSYEQYKQWYVR